MGSCSDDGARSQRRHYDDRPASHPQLDQLHAALQGKAKLALALAADGVAPAGIHPYYLKPARAFCDTAATICTTLAGGLADAAAILDKALVKPTKVKAKPAADAAPLVADRGDPALSREARRLKREISVYLHQTGPDALVRELRRSAWTVTRRP
jgi:hypothetical protein